MKSKLVQGQLYRLLWLPLMVLFLIGTSCKRLDGDTVVEGQVVDRHTGEPVPNAVVTVYSRKGNATAFNGLEFDKQADDNGNFSFRFEGESNKSYALRAFKDPGYYTAWTDAAYLEEGRNNKKIKLKAQAPAWVKVKLVNTAPKDEVERLHLSYYLDMINGQDYTTLNNYDRDTSFVRMVQGNKEQTFLYTVKPLYTNEVVSNPRVFFPAMDTTDLVLNY